MLFRSGKSDVGALGVPDASGYPMQPLMASKGTIYVASEWAQSDSPNAMNAIEGSYAHELANLLDLQVNGLGKEQTYGNGDPHTNYNDTDTGMRVEVEVFGAPQYP